MTAISVHQLARRSQFAALITGGGALLVISALTYGSLKLERLREEVNQLSVRRDTLQQEVRDLDAKLAEKHRQVDLLTPLALTGLGHKNPSKAEASAVRPSLEARKEAERLALNGKDRRRTVILRYYPKELDRDVNEGI